MKKNDYRGMLSVYRFTLEQLVKTKSFLVSFGIMVVMAIAVFPIVSAFSNSTTDFSEISTNVQQIYITNETDINFEILENAFAQYDNLSDIQIINTDKTENELIEDMSTKHEAALILRAYEREDYGSLIIDIRYDEESSVTGDDAENIGAYLSSWINDNKIELLDLSEKNADIIANGVETEIVDASFYVNENEGKTLSKTKYNIVYTLLLVSYMIIIFTANMVSGKVVEEKTNRIVEYLMTSVRPMALIIGKVLAMMTSTLLEMLIIMACSFVSNSISERVMGNNMIMNFINEASLEDISVIRIILCIAMILMGIFVFSLVASLFGASVTKMEELQQNMKFYSLFIVFSFLLAFVAVEMFWISGRNILVTIVEYLPFTSVFVCPGLLLIGDMTISSALICLAILVVFAWLVLKFVSLVYESVIVMNGKTITFRDMLKIAGGNK